MTATIRILRLRPKRRPENLVLFSSFSSSNHQPSNANSLEQIRKKLADSRSRFPPPPPDGGRPPSSPPFPSKHISFQELYKQSVASKGEQSSPGKMSFDAIRNSLQMLREKNPNPGGVANDPLSLNKYTDSLRLRPGVNLSPGESVFGSDKKPTSILGREIKDLKNGNIRTIVGHEFVRNYTYHELGEKLRSLSSEHKGKKNEFSIRELSDRLHKLRMTDEKESESRVGVGNKGLMDVLLNIKFDDEKSKANMRVVQTVRNLDILGQLGENSDYLLHPPKENLVEKYFDPVNMSSAEKMKLELKKVRDQFKMSESDCGSARVQVAQLTTKIKHLSGALHKKDKHSRKGLQAMVQKRKKLLKYLRRTDWDSYCLVLSSLGLRDNPDYKN